MVNTSGFTLEIATRCIDQFPKVFATEETIKQMIDQYDLDVIALQEVTSVAVFNRLKNALEGWEGFITQVNGSNSF